jgi:hypothetical protein
MRAWWISWYHDPRSGPFELHSPWWISGSTLEEVSRDTIVAAVQATDEKGAWEVIYASYDNRPDSIEQRFCNELTDREEQPNARQPWSTPENGRFPRADWMKWEVM